MIQNTTRVTITRYTVKNWVFHYSNNTVTLLGHSALLVSYFIRAFSYVTSHPIESLATNKSPRGELFNK